MPTHYAVNHPVLRGMLRLVDALLAGIRRRRGPPAGRADPKRILVCNQAHLGDAILATAVLPRLRDAYPDAEIGMLVHPDGLRVAGAHPGIRQVHVVEHWHLNRRGESLRARLWRHRQSTRAAVKAIRATRYDLAIDLYHYFPNSIVLLSRCDIPTLAGWDSGGFGPLLDVVARNGSTPMPVLERHAALLGRLGIASRTPLQPELPLPEVTMARWRARATAHGLPGRYVALHLGAHAEHRRWPTADWVVLARALIDRGEALLLLGQGASEVDACRQVAAACPAAIDLAGQLAWEEMLAAIAQCGLLVAHDSAPIHVAAAYDRPRICLAAGINDLRVWLQSHHRSVVLMHPVGCAPCGRTGGCATMDCLRRVSPAEVLGAFDRLVQETATFPAPARTGARP